MGEVLAGDVSQSLCHRPEHTALREMLDAQGRLLSLQILDTARQRDKRVKVVGGGHSPSDIACTDDFMIQMGKMNRVLKVRPASGRWRGGPEMWWHPCLCDHRGLGGIAPTLPYPGWEVKGWRGFPLLTARSFPKPAPETLVQDWAMHIFLV